MKKCLLGIMTVIALTSCSKSSSITPNNTPQVTSERAESFTVKTIEYKSLDNYTLSLDLYTPTAKTNKAYPLLIWVHGGAWFRGSKDEFIPKNGTLARSFLNEGYAIAAVNYSLSQQAIFPAQVQDINDAINLLHDKSEQYNLDVDQVVMMGRSAGGHLASLIATSNNDNDTNFYQKDRSPKYKVSAVVNFFGISNFEQLKGNSGRVDHDAPDAAEARLLGASPRVRPDLAKWASPTNYIDEGTPPFIIFHGSNDRVVPDSQSTLLKVQLDAHNITNQLFIEDGARHGDPVFDSERYVAKAVSFVKQKLK